MAMDYFLKRINPADLTPLIICLDKDEVTVGRSNIVSLTGFNKVSRKHASFLNKNGRWFVLDLRSLNKLYVNFKEVSIEWIPLEIGDIIGFGTPSYIEDGGLVCVFAAKTRVKQEIFDDIESSNFQTLNCENNENTFRLKDSSVTVKQELLSRDYTDCQKEMVVSTPVLSRSSSTLSNTENVSKVKSCEVVTSSNATAFQNKKISDFIELKPVIKTEPKEIDDTGLNSIKKTPSIGKFLKQQKLNSSKSSKNNLDTSSTYDNKLSLKNDNELRNQAVLQDMPSNKDKRNYITSECSKELNIELGLNTIHEKSLESTCKLQVLKIENNQKKPDMEYIDWRVKNCSVGLVKCDSKYFRWPPEINNHHFLSIDEHRHFSKQSIGKTSLDAKQIKSFFSKTSRKQNSESQPKCKKFGENIQENHNCVKIASNLKIKRNRILSSSSEKSSDESDREMKDANISFSIAPNKNRNKTELKKGTDGKRNFSIFQRETSQQSKVSEKRKPSFDENILTKKVKWKKKCDNPSMSNDKEDLNLQLSSGASVKKEEYKTIKISSYSRDESAFSVERKPYCSKYWTPEYNEFETGEVHDRLKSKVFIKTKQTAGRTLLIDPKPLEYRPKRMRSREEWCLNSSHDGELNEKLPENINEASYSLKSSSGRRFSASMQLSAIDTEVSSSETVSSSRKNTTSSFNTSSDRISSESFAVLNGTISKEFQKTSTQLSSKQVVALSIENYCISNREQSILDNSSLKSSAVPKQMNTNPCISKRRNSLGYRARSLVKVPTNADERFKNKGPFSTEIFPRCSVKRTESLVTDPTKTINASTFPVVEAAKSEKNNLNTNIMATSVSPNNRIANAPAPIFISSFEDKTQMKRKDLISIGKNELSIYKITNLTPEMESSQTKTNAKTSEMQFLPKEVFPKNNKIFNDKKVAVVSPVSHDNFHSNNLNQLDTVSEPYFHTSVKETITNRVHSTYILSPEKTSKPIQSDSDAIHVEDAALSSDAKFRSLNLIKCIVQWNPKWLEEQSKNKKPPPIVSKGCSVLPLRFSSYDSYFKSFYPMISLEIWESLFRESKPLWLKKETKNAFYYVVKANNVTQGLMELQCESVVNKNLPFSPCEGNIILLSFCDTVNGLENSLFGYIYQHKVESSIETGKFKEWQNVPKELKENGMHWTFTVFIKKSKKNFVIGSVNVAYGILNIKNQMHLVESLVRFKDSPVQNDILRPTKEMFSFCKSISKVPRPQLIHAVSDEIKKEQHSKLILINAPAATGKTGAIIGIVEKLLFSGTSKVKLLLCALSDMAVNEIGLRLVELNERYSWRGNYSIKFVRLGQSENIPAKLQAYTLERKVLKMFKEHNKNEFQERERELKGLEDKINDVLFKEQLKSNNKFRFRKRNDDALKQLMERLQSLKEKSLYKNIDPVIHGTYESSILNESDVVLATLNSCVQPVLRKFFKSCKEDSYTCCIIDEISQCTELDVLQSLHPEINRLVLVGDLQQLPPPVSSKYAIKCGFKRSMMERIWKLFSVQFSCPPPLSLAEQHRMQTQICHFPSKYFYKEQLVTTADIDERYKCCPLKPFVVYDILEKELQNPPINIEDNESFIIVNICAQLLQAVPTATIGVILPHEDLAALYRIPLSQGNTILKQIEVNTVENYQGVEKDIIIISCINPSLFEENDNFLSCEKKMNTAITRARQSLIICGHISSVIRYKHWAALIDDAKLRKSFISVSTLRHIPFVIMKTICRIG